MKLIFVIFWSLCAIFLFYAGNKIFSDFDDVSSADIENMIEEKKYEACVEYLTSKISKYPDNGVLYYEMAKVLFLKQDFKNALEYLDVSIKLGFPLVASYNLKAIIYGDKFKDYARQAEFSAKAIEIYCRRRLHCLINNTLMTFKECIDF